MKTDEAIRNIYAEREKFIIIGLTGRTGAGCTTVSNILGAEEFSKLNLREPKTTDFEKNEQRKYQIVYIVNDFNILTLDDYLSKMH